MRDKKVGKNKKMSTIVKKRRITRQVRVGIYAYKKLKIMAKDNKLTMSKLLDRIIKSYYKFYKNKKFSIPKKLR